MKLNVFFITSFLCFSSALLKGQNDYCSFLDNLEKIRFEIKLTVSIDSSLLSKDYIKVNGLPERMVLNKSTFKTADYIKTFDKLIQKDSFNFDFLFSSSKDRNLIGSLKLYAYHDSVILNRLVKKEKSRLIAFWDSIIKKKAESFEKNDPHLKQRLGMYYQQRDRIDFKYSFYQYLIKDSLSKAYLHFEPHRSKEGYFQYLIFYIMEKSGFYWFGHNFSRYGFICSINELNQALNRIRHNSGFDQDSANKLISLGPAPVIEILEKHCNISLIETDAKGCLWRKKYQINLDNLRITMIKDELRVGYDLPFD